MPRAPRKRKVDLLTNPGKCKGSIPTVVSSLAAEYELDLATLLDWKVYPNGKVVLIAPNGMKLVREVELESECPTANDHREVTAELSAVACLPNAGSDHER